MKTKLFTGFILILIITACNKDKFQTTPTIKIKDINSDVITPGGTLKITVQSSDKEGDEGGGVLTYIRVRTSVAIPTNDQADTVNYDIPSFPKTPQKDIQVNVDYGFMNEDPLRNDTMYFKFTLRDVAGNQSDTVTTKPVVAKQD